MASLTPFQMAAEVEQMRGWLAGSDEFNWLPDADRERLANALPQQPHYAEFKAMALQVRAGQMPDKAAYVDTAMAIARDADVSTPADSMILFTSNRLEEVKAEVLRDPSKWTNHKTPAVAMLGLMETFGDASPMHWKDAYLPWRAVSERFAHAAEGDIHVIADPAKDSTLWRVEMPAVLTNAKVATLDGLPKAEHPLVMNMRPAHIESQADFSTQADELKRTEPRVQTLKP